MDINRTKSMETHFLHNQVPFNPSWPSYLLQTPSSTIISTQMPTDHDLIHHQLVEDQEQQLQQQEPEEEELSAMKEMLYKIACMQPVNIDPSTIPKPKRRNVRISDDPQSVAARHRRERISEKMRILKGLVPGGTKMDTASMLDEAILYVKFLKRQIRVLQQQQQPHNQPCLGFTFAANHEVISD